MANSAPARSPAPAGGNRMNELGAATLFMAVANSLVLCAAIGGRQLLRPAFVNHVTARVIDAFRMGDARAYEDIARNGYSWNGDPLARCNVAFFPVYPWVGRALSAATGMSVIGALLFTSNVAFTLSGMLLWSYLLPRSPERAPNLGWQAVLLMTVIPTGCFFRLAYSESLLLLLAVGSFFLMERRIPLPFLCFVVGLATATRAVGAALVFALAIFVLERPQGLSVRLRTLCWALPASCWGIIAWMFFQWLEFGDSLAFARAQAGWCLQPDGTTAEKWTALASGGAIWTVYDPTSPVYWAKRDPHGIAVLSMHFANPLLFVFAIVLTIVGARRGWLTRPEVAFSAAALAIPYFSRAHEMGMGSMGRFVAVVFPIYIVGGRLIRRLPPPIATAAVCVMVCLLISFSALFSSGYGIY